MSYLLLSNLLRASVKHLGRAIYQKGLRELEYGLNQIFPKQCLRCGKIGNNVCDDCQQRLPTNWRRWRSPQLLNLPVSYLGLYQGWLRRLITNFKFEGLTDLAAIWLASTGPQPKWINNFGIASVVLVPVPLSRQHFVRRGYNQAEVIARILGKKWGLPVDNYLKEDWRWQQSHLQNRQQRLVGQRWLKVVKLNVSAQPIKVIMVDDVITTGTTLKQCQKALVDSGYQVVGAIVLAATPRYAISSVKKK